MLNKTSTRIERIIAKIDNDFNPDNSDWIPRVGAWTIDAMNMLKVLRKKKKRTKLIVRDRIAYSNCCIDELNIKVFDSNGCEIKKANGTQSCGCSPSTGKETETIPSDTSNTTDVIIQNPAYAPDNVIAQTVNTKDYPSRYNVVEQNYKTNNINRNYVIIDDNKIELNFDANYVYIEQDEIETSRSELYGCELPVIPNNGILIEAITYYCMYKMLCRGYRHPVFNLHASQYGTNPYYMWQQMKDEAARSVMFDEQGDVVEDGGVWQSAFYNQTFMPRE